MTTYSLNAKVLIENQLPVYFIWNSVLQIDIKF